MDDNLTMAQHDAAVGEAQRAVEWYIAGGTRAVLTLKQDAALTALIAAAEARGAARATTDPATLALARLGAAMSKHGRLTRDGWGLVEDARDIPNIDARITELLEGET